MFRNPGSLQCFVVALVWLFVVASPFVLRSRPYNQRPELLLSVILAIVGLMSAFCYAFQELSPPRHYYSEVLGYSLGAWGIVVDRNRCIDWAEMLLFGRKDSRDHPAREAVAARFLNWRTIIGSILLLSLNTGYMIVIYMQESALA